MFPINSSVQGMLYNQQVYDRFMNKHYSPNNQNISIQRYRFKKNKSLADVRKIAIKTKTKAISGLKSKFKAQRVVLLPNRALVIAGIVTK